MLSVRRDIMALCGATIAGLALLVMVVVVPQAASAPGWQAKVDPWILEQLEKTGTSEAILFLKDQADLGGANALPTKLEKGRYVVTALQATAARTQPSVLAELRRLEVSHRAFWIANMVWVRAGRDEIERFARRSDIASIHANPHVPLDALAVAQPSPLAPGNIEWNIVKVQAPAVWAMGVTGQGVVVAGQDTGYQWDHPALKRQYRGWNGSSADHNYNWHDAIHSSSGVCGSDSLVPCDDSGHGTHTMGTMVGDDGASNQIGMAPGARWIGCRNMDGGVGTPATYSECFEWFMAPTDLSNQKPDVSKAPHVVNNSWSCPPSEGCTDPTVLRTVVENTRAAGIAVVVSAGNSGYAGCGTVNTPPAIYDGALTVGATNSTDIIAAFSSRGPVTVDGSNRLKPDISAPGVSIRSAEVGGGYGVLQGTSMAAPHVAGLMALLISANNSYAGDVASLESLVTSSAVPRTTTENCGGIPGSEIPNNTYGYGRIDALAAFEALPRPRHYLALLKQTNAETRPGANVEYQIVVTHSHPTSPTYNVVLSDVIPNGTQFYSATTPFLLDGRTVTWNRSSLAPGEVWRVDMTTTVAATTTGTITNAIYGTSSDEVAYVSGAPVTTTVLGTPNLSLAKQVDRSSVYQGEPLTYTLTVTNLQPLQDAHNVVVTDAIPAGTTFITATAPFSHEGNVISWRRPVLDGGTSWSLNLVVRAALTATGTITNAYYAVNSDETGRVTGPPIATTVVPLFALDVTKTAAPSPVHPGGWLTYTISLTNLHPILPLHEIVLSDTVPLQTELVTATLPFAFEAQSQQVYWHLPLLEGGGSWQVSMTVKLTVNAEEFIHNDHYGAASAEVAYSAGPPVATPVSPKFRLLLPVAVIEAQ